MTNIAEAITLLRKRHLDPDNKAVIEVLESLEPIEACLEPVIDWYQSDEHEARAVIDVIKDMVTDLKKDRSDILAFQKAFRTGRHEPLVTAYETSMASPQPPRSE